MLRDAVNAFVDHDSADVRSVIERDDEVNKLQASLFRAIRAHARAEPVGMFIILLTERVPASRMDSQVVT